jgi:dienelactone hydrolase
MPPTIVWAVAAVCALALHEYLATRSVSPAGRSSQLRRAVLMILLASTIVVGPKAQGKLVEWWRSSAEPAIPFDHSGDPLHLVALAAQRPRDPFPVNAPPESLEAWRQRILDQIASHTGLNFAAEDHSASPPLTVVATEMVSGLRRTLIRFTSWDGTQIPAYVLEPQGQGVKGAVLVVPGHGPGITATAGLVHGYEHMAALELAKRGFITLTPELRGFGMLSPEGVPTHRLVAAAALAAGTSYKAIVGRDLTRALTVLEHWQDVDPSRLAVTGTSLGGELAVFLGALDPRVRVTVSNSYGGATGTQDEDEKLNDDSRQTPHGCHTMPGINQILLREDWLRLIAPRPALVVRGDRNVPSSARTFEGLVSQAYRGYGATERFRVSVEPGEHEFYLEATADFLARWL